LPNTATFDAAQKNEEEQFAAITHSDVARIEDGIDDTDFHPRTVRVCAVYTREDVALLVFQLGKVRDVLNQIKKLLFWIVFCAVIVIVLHWWR
jgi:hypothetical protein